MAWSFGDVPTTFQYYKLQDGREFVTRAFVIEPSEVDQRVRNMGPKRLPNLTFEDLRAAAVDVGVGDLYNYAVSTFGKAQLQKRTTRSSIAFEGSIGGNRKVVVSLIPRASSAERGLNFQLYKTRYAQLGRLTDDETKARMPTDHGDWAYITDGGPDWEGFEGFIHTTAEIDRMAGPLNQP